MKNPFQLIAFTISLIVVAGGCFTTRINMNRFYAEYKDNGLANGRYNTVVLLPYIQYPALANIDQGFQEAILETCSDELIKSGFQVVDIRKVENYLEESGINISEKLSAHFNTESLKDGIVQSPNLICAMGKDLNADAVSYVQVIRNLVAPLNQGGEVDLEITFFDVRDASEIGHGYASVVHGIPGHKKRNVFQKIFRSFFKDLQSKN